VEERQRRISDSTRPSVSHRPGEIYRKPELAFEICLILYYLGTIAGVELSGKWVGI
jgi:hypothetical protein